MILPLVIPVVIFVIIAIFFGLFAFTGAPYVPSQKKEIEFLFKKLYPLKKSDCLVDLGSGDGIVLKIACEKGASAWGFELNPVMVLISKIRLKKHRKAVVIWENIYRAKFPDETTIVYIFGDDRDFKKIEDKIQSEANRLQKTLYFVSLAFKSERHEPIKTYRAYFLYKIKPQK